MNKELQDKAWLVLPKEFKEEVKYKYNKTKTKKIKKECDLGFLNAHEGMFGVHNLTSDAEGEEMLTVSRKNVQRMYSYNEEEITKDPTNKGALLLKLRLDALFGSKCLPDEGTDCTPVEVAVAKNTTTSNVDSLDSNVESLEPKSAKPKFKEGDIVRYRYDGKLYTVVCKTGKYYYALRQPDGDVMIHDVLESDLEPYTEPKKKRHVSVKEACEILGVDESEATTLVKSKPIKTCTDDCSSPDHFVVKDEMVDNIIKDGFKNHNRLHIAAMAMAGLLANPNNNADLWETVADALDCADALIAKSEKGGEK